ncbi:MAG: aldehyde ferredoxin oxidoreductase family protein [Actinomycetota bacterium]|nr:aldehyde ferredoxin oxidoreductase family protein [Actinomycetota bacterium]MDD5667116.1 aldehyde ferredoxin oxidoreductase family protein [Actinomycetota bacterium]
MKGFAARYLEVDLGTGEVEVKELDEALYRRYIGGTGLAAYLFLKEMDPLVDPLSPDNPLMFMNGPLTGTSFPGSGRSSVVAMSPLTGLWGECNVGGSFGAAVKLAGYDGIVFKGRAEKPVFFWLDGEAAELRDASSLWGLDAYETNVRLQEELKGGGGAVRTMQIGPAGENGVSFAAIVNEIGSVAGRCGLGTVMGSKNLKAVAVRGGGRMEYADPEAAKGLSKRLAEKLKGSILAGTLHEMGTNGALDTGMLSGDVPVKNWSVGEWMDALDTLNSFYYNDNILVKIIGCYACSVRCKRVVKVGEGPFAMHEHAGPEYETVCMMGTNLMNPSLEAVAKANDLCNRMGMDTIAMGAVIALLMEAQEKGIAGPDRTGLDLSWGNMEAAMEAIRLTAAREGFGENMARGSRALATELGAPELAVTVRGLDFPAHDPRGYHGYGLGYVMSTRGACHLNSVNLLVEGGMGSWPEVGMKGPYKGMTSKGKADITWKCLAIGQLFNSLCMCEFIGAFLNLDDQVEMMRVATGFDMTLDELMECGWRIWYLKRHILNLRGSGRNDDVLPPKALTPTEEGANAGSVPNMERMLAEIYELAGLDAEGRIPPSKLEI